MHSKVFPLSKLSSHLHECRGSQSVVLCHGAFDLLHIGHLRHFNAARKHGDILVVTLTADQFIKKGPDRPVFPSELRAEMIAALEIVDFVAVVEDPSALPAIEAVKPDVYIKGGEYEDASKDITGKITIEMEAVERHGGRLVFTHEETFSSSRILNQHFGVIDGYAKEYLNTKRDTDLAEQISGYINQIADMHVVVIGETIIDRYVYVDALGKTSKDNIIATLRRNEEVFAGGAVAAAGHLASLCSRVELITLVGDPADRDNYESVVREALPPEVDVRKTRFVEPTYVRKLFEVYDMDDVPLPSETKEHFHRTIREKCAGADLVIICDFGHGLIGQETVELLEDLPTFLAVNAQSNAGNIGFNLVTKYQRPDLVCVDAQEARLATREKHAGLTDLTQKLGAAISACPRVIVTDGKRGCHTIEHGQDEAVHVPSFGQVAIDTVGAGDAFFVTAAPFVAAGADAETAGLMGNIAGSLKIGIVGHRRYLQKQEIQRYLTTLLK
jgi:rfaE bifunctional protein nucleotidyltransferase chain/domain